MNFWSQIINVYILFWDVYNFWNKDDIKILTSDSRSGSKTTHIVDFLIHFEHVFIDHYTISTEGLIAHSSAWQVVESIERKEKKTRIKTHSLLPFFSTFFLLFRVFPRPKFNEDFESAVKNDVPSKLNDIDVYQWSLTDVEWPSMNEH